MEGLTILLVFLVGWLIYDNYLLGKKIDEILEILKNKR
jgi:hypothetical protein